MNSKTLFNPSVSSYPRFLTSRKPALRDPSTIKRSIEEEVDRDAFRHSLSLQYQYIYAMKKWQNWIYRIIFLVFSVLFFSLSVIIFFKTANFSCGLYFKNCDLIKNSVNIFSFFFALFSSGVALLLQPKKEAMHYVIEKAKRDFHASPSQLQIELEPMIVSLVHDWERVYIRQKGI